MAELWGDDDYLYGDYLKWRRGMPGCIFLALIFMLLVAIGLFINMVYTLQPELFMIYSLQPLKS